MDHEGHQSDSPVRTRRYPDDQDLEYIPCEVCDERPDLLVHENTTWDENEVTIRIPYAAGRLEGNQRLLLHGSCSTCANGIDERNNELCAFCGHLRLRHLLFCEGSYLNHGEGTYMGVCMGTVEEVFDREAEHCKSCSMCGVITRSLCYLEAQGIDWDDVKDEEVWLWFKKNRFVLRATRRRDGSFRTWYFGIRLLRSEISKNMDGKDEYKSDQQPAVLGKKIDWHKVDSWLKECRRDHQPCNSDTSGFWDPRFRVIDVYEGIVTRLPSREYQFVALSYVWGTGPENEKAQLTKNSIETFKTPGGLDDLPATIQDAIKVCTKLRRRFLWVDRLCIIQDSDSDKLHQLKLMDRIYSSAEFVIVAACVKGANGGLRGVSRRRAESQFQARVLDFEVTSLFPELEKALERSKWGSRGWTFQEEILAKKKLYFTLSEVWFVCQEGGHREDQYGTEERLKIESGAHHSRLRLSSVFWDYARLAGQYAGRVLTNQSDVYDAFSGIQNALYPDTRAIYGLPECDLDRALLWSVPNDSVHPRLRRAQGTTLPSWSWASIKGQIEYGDENLGLPLFPLVKWAFFDQGTICSMNSAYHTGDWTDKQAQTFLAIAWTEGCIEAESPFQFGEMGEYWEDETPFPVSRKDLKRRWPTPAHFLDEISLNSASSDPYDESRIREITSQDEDIMKNLRHPGVIFTRASTAHFNVEITKWDKLWSINRAGALVNFKEFKMRTGMRDGDRRMTELMALSVGIPPRGFWNLADQDELKDFNYSTPDCVELQPPPILIVMAIDRQGPFARRLGLGYIYLRRWAAAKPKFETILLK